MLRKMFLFSVAAMALVLVPAAAQAQFSEGDWELTLNGSGTSSKDFDSNTVSVNGSLGYFVSDQIEIALRQGVSWTSIDQGPDVAAFATRVAADYHFDLDRWQPFVGVVGGGVYGDEDVLDSFVAGPEAGVKYFVNSTTFVFAAAEYEFFFNSGDADVIDTGQFVYSIGMGVRLGNGT